MNRIRHRTAGVVITVLGVAALVGSGCGTSHNSVSAHGGGHDAPMRAAAIEARLDRLLTEMHERYVAGDEDAVKNASAGLTAGSVWSGWSQYGEQRPARYLQRCEVVKVLRNSVVLHVLHWNRTEEIQLVFNGPDVHVHSYDLIQEDEPEYLYRSTGGGGSVAGDVLVFDFEYRRSKEGEQRLYGTGGGRYFLQKHAE